MSASCGCYVNILKYHHKVIQCGVVYNLECFLMAPLQCLRGDSSSHIITLLLLLLLELGLTSWRKCRWRQVASPCQQWPTVILLQFLPCNHRNQRSTVSFYVEQANRADLSLSTVFHQHQRLIGTERACLYGYASGWSVKYSGLTPLQIVVN